MKSRCSATLRERGMALVSSLLLLLIITIIAMSMFRSFGSQEKIAGNLREKDRALHAATSVQQYAEWWLTQPAGSVAASAPVTCAVGAPLNANAGQGQICTSATSLLNLGINTTQQLPWPVGYIQYSPVGMATPLQAGNNNDPAYAWTPGFYIVDLGLAADAAGEAYQIDAFSSGATTGTVAVVESTYEVQQGVVNRGGL
ncbi:MAG TPA: PilX N-terminal domain-containing pilus assembly protein [Steroidobacteraceae bacterium]|jgi:type IV pilus assembly protein PilX|nr:PilX N-terminal domain-containing pilus assembly protein [Steroidobacteraceae bacterium]